MAVTLPIDWTPERKAAFKLYAQRHRVQMMTLVAAAVENEFGAEIDKAELILGSFALDGAPKQHLELSNHIAAIGGD